MDRSSLSGLPGRFGALDALLHAAQSDVGQSAIVESAELLARPAALAPQRQGGGQGGPNAERQSRRADDGAKGVMPRRVKAKRHRFHLFDTPVSWQSRPIF